MKEEGVSHVMRTFMRHYAASDGGAGSGNAPRAVSEPARNALFDIVCDEEAIARF